MPSVKAAASTMMNYKQCCIYETERQVADVIFSNTTDSLAIPAARMQLAPAARAGNFLLWRDVKNPADDRVVSSSL